MSNLSIAVLISGNGSNLQAIIDAIQQDTLNAKIAVVVSNRADAYGLKRAEQANIPTEILTVKPQETREAYDQRLSDLLKKYQPDIIVLAGFMRILSAQFIQNFAQRILNIHPSLLPNYRGLDTHERVLSAKETHHGTTVHLVTEELDSGPILGQATYEIAVNETPESLKQKIQALEHQLYPKVIQMIANGRLKLTDPILFDDKPLIQPISL